MLNLLSPSRDILVITANWNNLFLTILLIYIHLSAVFCPCSILQFLLPESAIVAIAQYRDYINFPPSASCIYGHWKSYTRKLSSCSVEITNADTWRSILPSKLNVSMWYIFLYAIFDRNSSWWSSWSNLPADRSREHSPRNLMVSGSILALANPARVSSTGLVIWSLLFVVVELMVVEARSESFGSMNEKEMVSIATPSLPSWYKYFRHPSQATCCRFKAAFRNADGPGSCRF